MLVGLAAIAFSQTPAPAPTPAPLNVPLATSINATTTTTTTSQVTEVKIQFIVITPDEGRMVVKIQPLNEDVIISGDEYKEFSDSFRAALAGKLKQKIDAYLAAKAAAP